MSESETMWWDTALGGTFVDRGEAIFQGKDGQVVVKLLEDCGGMVWAISMERFLQHFEPAEKEGP